MSLRLASIGSLGCLSLCTLLACSESQPAPSNGTGGGGSGTTGGMPSAGTSPATSGSSSGGGGSSSAGSANGGTPSGGSASAGTSAGGSASGGTGGSGGTNAGGSGGGSAGSASKTTFFVTSDTSATGKLGGLAGADMRCQMLATAAGITGHTFKAYLSTSTVNAKDRIGTGPWYNANGVLLAMNVADLHNAAMVKGDEEIFITEKKEKINGQWDPSMTPNEHDILTGTKADGTVSAGATCADWTSNSADDDRQVGHSDGTGPNMDMAPPRSSWVEAHIVSGCNTTAPGGGSGRIYCFAAD